MAEARIQTAQQLHHGDRIMVTGQTTGVYTATLDEMRLERGLVEEVSQGDVFSFKTNELLHRGDKLYRIDKVVDEF